MRIVTVNGCLSTGISTRELPGAQDELIKTYPRRLNLSRIVLPSRQESRNEEKQLVCCSSVVVEVTILIRSFSLFFFFLPTHLRRHSS